MLEQKAKLTEWSQQRDGRMCDCGSDCKLEKIQTVREESNYVDADTAIRLMEGEYIITNILQRDENKLQVEWNDGSKTWQPLEMFLDYDEDGNVIAVTEKARQFLSPSEMGEESQEEGDNAMQSQQSQPIQIIHNHFNHYTINGDHNGDSIHNQNGTQ